MVLVFKELGHICVWTGLQRKEELCDKYVILLQYPHFVFLLSRIRTVREGESVVSLDCVREWYSSLLQPCFYVFLVKCQCEILQPRQPSGPSPWHQTSWQEVHQKTFDALLHELRHEGASNIERGNKHPLRGYHNVQSGERIAAS